MQLNISKATHGVIVHALSVAKERYLLDAANLKEMHGSYGQERLIEQFEKQARECEEVIEILEEYA